jgi:site-specific DNA-methyltransferase (adenine-specific)
MSGQLTFNGMADAVRAPEPAWKLAVHFTAERDDWPTPDCVLERVRRVGEIGLDPCAGARPFGAVCEYRADRGEDGLALSWRGKGLTYVNPPYGRSIGAWVAQCSEADECIALLPARPDTAWWHEGVVRAQAILFWRGRLTFVGAEAPAPFPSAVAYWGPRPGKFVEAFGDAGWLVFPCMAHRRDR